MAISKAKAFQISFLRDQFAHLLLFSSYCLILIFILTCWLPLFTVYGFELLCNGTSDAQRNGLEQANICFFTDLPSCQSHKLENCFPNSEATGHFTTTILAREVTLLHQREHLIQ